MSHQCRQCHTVNRSEARFCGRCGAAMDLTRKQAASAAGLYLHEELLLLALKDEEGTVEFSASGGLPFALAGGVLAELVLAGRISIEPSGKHIVTSLGSRPIGDPLLDETAQRIHTATRRKNASTWVQSIAATRELRHRIARGLCARGILAEVDDKVLLIFPRRRYPQRDQAPEDALVHRIRTVVAGSIEPDVRTVLLLSLAKGGGLLDPVFSRRELRAHKRRIEALVKGNELGGAVRSAIQAVQAAMTIACVIPVIAACSS
ncbi:MAG: hypothetical protein CHACPFDD_00026 [Phycisphaerae bacterium]|nr:hypothetical protein [Phycisphaerae bacterium]